MFAVLRLACVLVVVSGSTSALSDQCSYALNAGKGQIQRSNERLEALRTRWGDVSERYLSRHKEYKSEFDRLTLEAQRGGMRPEDGRLAMFTLVLDEVDYRQATIADFASLFHELDTAWKDRQAIVEVLFRACMRRR